MRIIWDDQENRFLAEFTPGEQWREDMEAAKTAGFKTTGPPAWQWYTSKASTLNKLRENRPKSGLVLTEVAFEKYQILNKKEEQKAALKKQFKIAQKEAKQQEKFTETETYFDVEIGVMCLVVKPLASTFTMAKIRTEKLDGLCVVCGDPLYLLLDYPDICLWCDKLQKVLDKDFSL